LSFGSVGIGGSSASQTITVTNGTSASVALSGAGISGTNAADFAVSSTTCGSSLGASASCTANVFFKPTATGARGATWAVNDGSGPLSVALSGSGVSSAGSASASPTSITWGQVAVGQAGGPKTATLANTGGSPISISSIAFTGANSGDFAIYQQTCGSTLAASASCTVTILFKPTASGTRTANLAFIDSASNSPQQVSLSGLGAGGSSGTVAASPTSLNFGSVSLGSSSASQIITVTNSTSSSVTMSASVISGANSGDFAISSTSCGSTLAASASCTASVLFEPTAAGARAAAWTLTIGSSPTPLSVALSGSGVNSSGITLTASPSSMVWGSVPFGQTSGAKTATLTNGGSAAVSINSITVTGVNPGDFSVSSNTCGSSLAASSSCVATIFFAPKATGERTATLSFNDAAGNSPQTIPLSGTGGASTSGAVTTEPSRLTFPQTLIGTTSSTLTASLMNGGASAINLSGSAMQGAQASEFTQVSTTCGASLASNTSCTVEIAFAPAGAGTRTATLSFTDSASNSPQGVSLSGVGTSSAAGSATASPSSLSFGNFAVGSSSGSRLVTLTNSGSSTIGISGATITGTNATDFSITSQSCGSNLAASQSCSFHLIFAPTGTGSRTATLSITDGAANSPQTVALSGGGTPAPSATLTISPSGIAWGSQNVGATTAAKTFTLTSSGAGSVSFSSIGFTGTDPEDFSITANTCGSTLAQSSSCTVTVAFKPSAIGNRVALFSVADNAVASPQTAEVSGSGAYSTAQSAAITIDFGSRSGSQVAIPAGILGTEYLESLPTNANRATVVQAGFTTARYRLAVSNIYSTQTPSWGALDSDMAKFSAVGVHPLVDLVDTPAFLQPSPSPCPGDPPTSVPTDVNQWGHLAASILAHLDQKFPGLVQKYEIWNEPDTTALCSNNKFNDYVSIYAAAAPQLKAQAKTDGVTILVGGPATAGPAFPTLLTNSATAPYVDFYSYHFYEGSSGDIANGMTWDGAGGTPSLYQKLLDPKHGVQALFLQAYNQVKAGKTPLGAKMPIYFDEYNDDWAFEPECCRNSPTYSPLFNSMTVAQLLNSVYNGAGEVPGMLIYYSAAQQTFCLLGIVNSAMNCNKAATGDQAQPYPQWYTYQLMFAPSFLDLQDGGHMAASVTLSSSASSAGLIATGWYTGTKNAILVINPTASSFAGVTVQMNNPGLSSPTSTLYTINAQNPQVSQWPASTVAASGGLQTTFDLPPYSVIAIALK
ncbi:MAG: choice-of-anchor D domain-containing protein, partial [Acidobacteriaceae bacterium]